MKWVYTILGCALAIGAYASMKPQEQRISMPIAIAPAEENLAVVGNGSKNLHIIDRSTGEIKSSIALSNSPNGLCVEGDFAYVTLGGAVGMIRVVNWKTGELIREIRAGHTPMNPVKKGNSLFIANRFDHEIAEFDVSTGKRVHTWRVVREPVGLVASSDGETIWVINHLPDGASNGEYAAAALSRIQEGEIKHFPLLNGTQSMRGIAMSPNGRFLAVTHLLSRYQVPTTQLDRGWMNTNAVTIVDTENPEKFHSVLLDDADRGAANPWAIAFSEDGSKLVVSHAGLHELSVIDFPELLKKLLSSKLGGKSSEKLSYLEGVRTRIPLSLNGPRALTLIGSEVFVAGYFSDSVSKVQLNGKAESVVWSYGDDRSFSTERLGERYFNDASLCFQGWQSCASCHPDSRMDGLNWDLLNDGMGNPKNTRTMFLSHRTDPVMSLGVRKNAEIAVNAGFKYIQFVDSDKHVLACVNEYLREMKEVPSPALIATKPEKPKMKDASCAQCHAPGIERGILSESAVRGRELFKKSGCVQCHPHPWFTTKQLCDVGTATGLDEGKKILVPSLVEAWRTGPYLHDGRAKTIKEAISIYNRGDKRGKTSTLSPRQIDDLAEYVRSL